ARVASAVEPRRVFRRSNLERTGFSEQGNKRNRFGKQPKRALLVVANQAALTGDIPTLSQTLRACLLLSLSKNGSTAGNRALMKARRGARRYPPSISIPTGMMGFAE